MKWYYAEAGRQKGPVDDASLDQLVAQGVVRGDTLVWSEGMDAWQPHSAVRGVRPAAPPPFAPPAYAAAGPAYAPPGPAAPAMPLARHYGGFWIRFLARFIDGIILGFISFIVRMPFVMLFGLGTNFGRLRDPGDFIAAFPALMGFMGLSMFLGIAIGLAYEVFFLSTRGATPGKMLLGLKVVRAGGGPLSPPLAAGRYFGVWLSYLTLLIGFIIAAFDPEKRALHDHICETRVIYAR